MRKFDMAGLYWPLCLQLGKIVTWVALAFWLGYAALIVTSVYKFGVIYPLRLSLFTFLFYLPIGALFLFNLYAIAREQHKLKAMTRP